MSTVPSVFTSWRRDPRDPFLKEWMEEEMKIILKISRGKVLDIGCGDGYVLEVLRSHGFEVHGIDINRSFAELARKKGLSCIWGDARELPYPDSSFDTVLIVNATLGNIPFGKIRVLREANRVLKPGGKGFVSVYRDDLFTLKHRLISYRSFGLHPKVLGPVVIDIDVHSEAFSEERLQTLLGLAGIENFELLRIGRIGIGAVWKNVRPSGRSD